MTQPSTSPAGAPTNGAPPAAGLEAIAALSTPEQRISALKEHLDAREPDAEGAPANGTPPKDAATAEVPAHVAERRKRLAAFQAKERAANEARARTRPARTPPAQQPAAIPESAQKQIADARRYLETIKESPLGLLQVAEELGHDVGGLAEAIKKGLANPEKLAGAKAREELAPILAEAKKAVDELIALKKQIADERARGTVQAQNDHHHRAFLHFTGANHAAAPLAAAFAENDPAEFIDLVNGLAEQHGNPALLGPQGLLDLAEEALEAFQKKTSARRSTSSRTSPPTSPSRAPTNRTASDRATVTDPDAEWSAIWDAMSPADRIRHIKDQRRAR